MRYSRSLLRLSHHPLRALLPAALLLLGACVYNNHATWWVGDVASEWHDCHAVSGTRAVLDLQEFRSSIIVPFAWGGYRLFVLTDPKHLQPGSTLNVPSLEASAILCDLGHGAPGDALKDVTGTVEVLKRRGEDVLLRLDLKGKRGYWSYRGKRWFERQGTPLERP